MHKENLCKELQLRESPTVIYFLKDKQKDFEDCLQSQLKQDTAKAEKEQAFSDKAHGFNEIVFTFDTSRLSTKAALDKKKLIRSKMRESMLEETFLKEDQQYQLLPSFLSQMEKKEHQLKAGE